MSSYISWTDSCNKMEIRYDVARKVNDVLSSGRWTIDSCNELTPIDSSCNDPRQYLTELREIILIMIDNNKKVGSGYSFTYEDQDYRSVGCINVDEEGNITFCEINEDGVLTTDNIEIDNV